MQLVELNSNLNISDERMLKIIEEQRLLSVEQYHRLVYGARLNDLVENTKMADQQREEAKKFVVLINQMDSDIEELKRKIEIG